MDSPLPSSDVGGSLDGGGAADARIDAEIAQSDGHVDTDDATAVDGNVPSTVHCPATGNPFTVFVDAKLGADTNDGTIGSPVKSLTHAVSLALMLSAPPPDASVAQRTVCLRGDAAGTANVYGSTTTGETFPISLGGGALSIQGESRALVVLESGAASTDGGDPCANATDPGQRIFNLGNADQLTLGGVTLHARNGAALGATQATLDMNDVGIESSCVGVTTSMQTRATIADTSFATTGAAGTFDTSSIVALNAVQVVAGFGFNVYAEATMTGSTLHGTTRESIYVANGGHLTMSGANLVEANLAACLLGIADGFADVNGATFQNAAESSICLFQGAARVKVRASKLLGAANYGLNIDPSVAPSQVDLGSVGDPGGNVIESAAGKQSARNVLGGICWGPASGLVAAGDGWSACPPTTGACGTGADIGYPDGGAPADDAGPVATACFISP